MAKGASSRSLLKCTQRSFALESNLKGAVGTCLLKYQVG